MNASRVAAAVTALGFAAALVTSALATPALGATPAKKPAIVGNAKAGKKDFQAHGCGSCHNLAAAGVFDSSGTGPDLDHIKLTYTQILNQITKGGKGMTPYKAVLTVAQIQDLSAFIYGANHPKT